jgi:hypothetical protein
VTYEVDISDQTFVVTTPDVLAHRFGKPEMWRIWWPDLVLVPTENRGLEGMRWSVAGALTGTAEVWLEQWRDGVIVHWFLRANRADARGRRSLDTLRRALVRDYKRRIHMLKDELERTRPAGVPPTGISR